jgi:putative endonuclease
VPADLKQLGAAGEKLAAKFLKKSGYKILARNYVCPSGEIDLVCFGDGAVVFVEVKTRQDDTAADPEANITPAKQRQIERAAKSWLASHRWPDCPWRIDAVSVVMPAGGEARVRHIIEAFSPRR